MFGRVARRYDLANHLLSGGLDFWWRARASEIVRQWQPARVLDLATGSGDLALTIARKLPQAEIIGADFSAEMLAIARAKGVRQTVVADALQLPFQTRASMWSRSHLVCATWRTGAHPCGKWRVFSRRRATFSFSISRFPPGCFAKFIALISTDFALAGRLMTGENEGLQIPRRFD